MGNYEILILSVFRHTANSHEISLPFYEIVVKFAYCFRQ